MWAIQTNPNEGNYQMQNQMEPILIETTVMPARSAHGISSITCFSNAKLPTGFGLVGHGKLLFWIMDGQQA